MLCANLVVLVLLGQAADSSRDAAALIEKLGSAHSAQREAERSLESLGRKALPALNSSLKSKDREVRARARALINKIEGRLLTQETLVRLDFKDATLDEIVKSLSKQLGFEIGIAPTGANSPGQHITLSDPQPVPFWKAIDRLREVGNVTWKYHIVNVHDRDVPQQGFVLSYNPNPVAQPVYDHGPFHFSVIAVHYQSIIYFRSSSTVVGQARQGTGNVSGSVKKNSARLSAEPSSGNAGEQDESEKAANLPFRSVQFRVVSWIVPEPRMKFGENGNLKLFEAVDELGQSLMPTPSALGRFGDSTRVVGNVTMSGTVANLSIRLHRPETPGKLIKKLRGTVETSVAAQRSNSLIIPLSGANGKTFENGDRRVVVDSIDSDQTKGQEVIVLKFEDLDGLFPTEAVDGVLRTASVTNDPWQSPIQVVTSKGQPVIYQISIDRESSSVTLRSPRITRPDETKEIRISSFVRAKVNIPFEFHDLPMP